MLVNDLLEKEVGNVEGSDTTYKSGNAFLITAKNDEVEVELVLSVKTKNDCKHEKQQRYVYTGRTITGLVCENCGVDLMKEALTKTYEGIEDLSRAVQLLRVKGYSYLPLHEFPNQYSNDPDDNYKSFDKALESGKSYLVGDGIPTDEFKRTHKSSIEKWMRAIVRYCEQRPETKIGFTINRGNFAPYEYVIYKRGEYVNIGLPHQDAGGERDWITKDGKTKYLVNVD